MFRALRNRFRTTSTPSGGPRQADTAAKVEALKQYLESLSDDARAEYIAAAKDLGDAMSETGVRSFHACYRGGRPGSDDWVPDGVHSLEELRSLARMIRTTIKPDLTATE